MILKNVNRKRNGIIVTIAVFAITSLWILNFVRSKMMAPFDGQSVPQAQIRSNPRLLDAEARPLR